MGLNFLHCLVLFGKFHTFKFGCPSDGNLRIRISFTYIFQSYSIKNGNLIFSSLCQKILLRGIGTVTARGVIF